MKRLPAQVTGKKKGHPVVLDVRNGYEWDAGHFDGVERPTEDSFCQTPVGSGEGDIPEALIGQDPNTPVMVRVCLLVGLSGFYCLRNPTPLVVEWVS